MCRFGIAPTDTETIPRSSHFVKVLEQKISFFLLPAAKIAQYSAYARSANGRCWDSKYFLNKSSFCFFCGVSDARVGTERARESLFRTVVHYFNVLPRVAVTAQRLDVRYSVATSHRQGKHVVGREQNISIATAKAHIAALLAKLLERLASEITLGV